jgi:zona occludens toxin (predicted ATPase)
MTALAHKKDLILQRELAFANAIGASVLDKPKVSFWMVLIPILFVYFIYRMQTFKSGRIKFDEEFMTNRRRAMDAALVAVETRCRPDIAALARSSGLPEALHEPYATWMKALVEYYMELLAADGHSFESLVQAAYRDRNSYLLALNRLTTVEKEYYKALKPHLEAAEGAADIIATIEAQSQQLRRELVEQVFR